MVYTSQLIEFVLKHSNRANHDVFEYLDLHKDPEPSIASVRSRMCPQSLCDCYCKTSSRTGQRRGNQTDRSRVRLVTSKSSLARTNVVKSARKSPLTPARLVDDQPDSNRSVTIPLDSPVLSPETSAVLDDMQKLVNDATIRMKEINILHRPNRFQSVWNTCSEEAPLDDEKDQLLYIRERVSYKFQEANGWIDTGYPDSKGQARLANGRVPKSKRFTDFSAPKFRTYKEYRKEYSYDSRGARHPECLISTDEPSERFVAKSANLNENRSPLRRDERRKKTETLSVRMGPSVNIERELVTQNLEDIHISPNPSFALENSNVGTYLVSQDFRARSSSPTRKEKVVKMVDKDDAARSGRKLASGKRGKKETIIKEFKANDSNAERVSGFEKKPGNSGQKNSNLKDGKPEDDEKATEAREHSGDEEIPGSDSQEVSKESSSIESVASSTNRETGIVREERNDLPASSASETKTEMRVRFSEEVLRRDGKESRVGETPNGEATKTLPETVQSENVPDPSFSKAEDPGAFRASPASEMPRAKKGKREKRIEESEEYKRNERYKMIGQRFANVLTKYCERERSSEPDGHSASSSVDTSKNSDNSEDLNDVYDPRVNDLDNVLLAYDKIINDVVRSTRTIEEFLSRPEIEEYRAQSEVSTKSSPSPLNEGEVEAKSREKVNVSQQTQTKRNTELRTKNSVLKNRSQLTRKNMNKELHARKSAQTKMSKPPKTVNKTSTIVKENRGPKRCTASNNPDRFATRSDSRRKFGAPKKQNKDSSEESSSRAAFSVNASSSSVEVGRRNGEESETVEDKGARRSKPIQDSEAFGGMNFEEDFDYAALCNMVHRDVLRQGFPEARRAPAVVEHLIARVLREETLLIENKIKSMFDANRIAPLLTKGLPENFQADALNPKARDLAPTPRGGAVSVEVQTSETGVKNGSLNAVEARESDKRIGEEEIVREASEAVKTPENKSSTNEGNVLHSENDGTSRTKSIGEALKEISSEINADGSVENDCAYLTMNDSDADSRSTKSASVVRRIGNEGNVTAAAAESDAERDDDELVNLHVEDTIDESLTAAKSSEVESELNREDSANSKEILLSTNEENLLEERKEKLLESRAIESERGTERISSSDSLRDCASLGSSPKKNSEASSVGKSSEESDGNERLSDRDIINGVEGPADQRFHDSIVNKERMLSDLYDDVHKKLFHSTLDSNRSNFINQNCRWSKSLSSITSNKTETQSDSSHSEGELYLLSSGSYSLGEVRVPQKNYSDGEATDACNDTVTIFVTKEMLTSWNESSKSLIQSIGQI